MQPDTWRLSLNTLLFTALVPGIVVVFVPSQLLAHSGAFPEPAADGLSLAALLLMTLGAWGYVCCAKDFVTRGRGTPSPFHGPAILLSGGIYRRTRNPMYLAVLLVLLAEALLFRSPALLAYALGIALVLQLLVVFFEEPRLKRQFGAQYAEYCRTVSRWGLGRR
jgi:protein-S-isoprenylcysteine O-methyltransferase Ste14